MLRNPRGELVLLIFDCAAERGVFYSRPLVILIAFLERILVSTVLKRIYKLREALPPLDSIMPEGMELTCNGKL